MLTALFGGMSLSLWIQLATLESILRGQVLGARDRPPSALIGQLRFPSFLLYHRSLSLLRKRLFDDTGVGCIEVIVDGSLVM